MNHRPLSNKDFPMLQKAIDQNTFHPGIPIGYYTGENKFSEVYEDDKGPVGVVTYSKTLRIAAVWCDNNDRSRNGRATVAAIKDAVERAQSSGFTEIIFNTNSPKLAEFCTKVLGFEESQGEYVKYIGKA
jgi:ribonuclease HI